MVAKLTTRYSLRFEFPQFQKSEINFSKLRRTGPKFSEDFKKHGCKVQKHNILRSIKITQHSIFDSRFIS